MSQLSSALDKDFIDLVGQDVRGNSSKKQHDLLHRDENLDRLYDALVVLKRTVEGQLASDKARSQKMYHKLTEEGDNGDRWHSYLVTPTYSSNGTRRPSPVDWRAKAIKFLGAIEANIAAAKERRRKRDGQSKLDEDVVGTLLSGIFDQKEEIDPESYTEADKRVFKLAEEIEKELRA